jgi:hypothetical protein
MDIIKSLVVNMNAKISLKREKSEYECQNFTKKRKDIEKVATPALLLIFRFF